MEGGENTMDFKTIIAQQAERHDSFYLYGERRILEDTERLKRNFPQVDFLYSIKIGRAHV